MHRIRPLGSLIALLGLPLSGQAQTTLKTGDSSAGPDTLISFLTLGGALVAVIAVILGCAWLVRRMNGMTGINHQAMKVVSVMALGSRERVALIEVGGTQILVGITPSAIRTLHVFDEPVVDPRGAGDSEFAKRLQSMIGRAWGRGEPGAGGQEDKF